MTMQIRKAARQKAKLRLGISGSSGAGKTYSALLIALGMNAGKIGLIDTEHGSGDLYADMGDYDIIRLDPPYTVAKYREALSAFEQAEYGVVIMDSISHAWAGEGGLLDKHGKITDSSQRKDSFAAWRMVTPEHNAFIDAMLRSPCHIIATMRSKTEYVIESVERNGRTIQMPRKIGMAPIQRDGMEYEFTMMLDLSAEHIATASKDRTGLFDGEYVKPDRALGAKIGAWLATGADPVPVPVEQTKQGIDKESLLDAIANSQSEEALKAAFDAAYSAAKDAKDAAFGQQVIDRTKTRKSELVDVVADAALRLVEGGAR